MCNAAATHPLLRDQVSMCKFVLIGSIGAADLPEERKAEANRSSLIQTKHKQTNHTQRPTQPAANV